MDKTKILKAVIVALEEDLRRQLKGQESAAEGATHAEARAETKWDTCGLEQSYLARGLAQQFEVLAMQLEELRAFSPANFTNRPVGVGALVETEMGGERDHSFLLNGGGGTEICVENCQITVITPESPVGGALLGKKLGDNYSFRAGAEGSILRVE